MNFDEAKVIVDELWKDHPELVVFGVNEFNNPTLSVSYGTNNKQWFNMEKGQHGWDLWIDNRSITYRMYTLDMRCNHCMNGETIPAKLQREVDKAEQRWGRE